MKRLPRKVHESHGALYWVDRNRWHRLCGADATDSELRQALARVQSGERPRTLGDLFAVYADQGLHELAPKTQRDYKRALAGPLLKVFGHMSIATLRGAHVAQYLETRKRQGKPVAGNRERAALSSCFAWSMRQGYAEHNPCVGVRRNRETPRSRYVSDEELAALMSAASEPIQDAIGIAYLTGMRRGDLLALTKECAHEDGLHWTEGKRKVARVVLWSDELLFYVRRAMERSQCEALLTRAGAAGWSTDGFVSAWRRTKRKAGVSGFTFHDLRAKAGSDHEDGRGLLAHGSEALFKRVYKRAAIPVKPVR
jgi:integrase